MNKILPHLLSVFLLTTPLYPVDPAEALFENMEGENLEAWAEELDAYKSHPILINEVSKKELNQFPLITACFSNQIIKERKRNSAFKSWDEFAKRMQVEPGEINWMRTYFIIKPKPGPPSTIHFRSRIIQKFPESTGFQTHAYQGSSQKQYERADFRYADKIRLGLLTEKDAGEQDWNDHQTGFIDIRVFDALRLLAGHYRIQAGQGLVLSGPYGIAKGSMPIAPAKRLSSRLAGYTLSDEAHDFYGIAAELKMKHLLFQIFTSDTKRDASFLEEGQISSLPQTGLHRTESEKGHLNRISEKLSGFRVMAHTSDFEAGFTGWQNQYSQPFYKSHDDDFYENTENQLGVYGIDLKFRHDNTQWHGEAAMNQAYKTAMLFGMHISHEKSRSAISYRRYNPGFHNPHGAGFSTEDPENREGWYWAYRHRVYKKSYISLFYDLNRTLWRTSTIASPQWRNDAFIEGSFYLSNTIQCVLRYRKRTKEISRAASSEIGSLDWISESDQTQWRWEMILYPHQNIRIRNRLAYNRVTSPEQTGEVILPKSREEGWLMYQEIRYNWRNTWRITGRWTTFGTDSWDSRIYVYENDIPGVMSIKPLYLNGTRNFILLKGAVTNFLTLGCKWSVTYHDGATSWGSGNDEITGDTIHELHLQIDLRW